MTQADLGHDPSASREATGYSWLARRAPGSGRLDVEIHPDAPDVTVAARDGRQCVVQGFVYGVPSGGAGNVEESASVAERLLDAYLRLGEGVLDHVNGFFSFVIWDPQDGRLLAARDPLGIHPLFYARTSGSLLLSPSIATLLGHEEVPRTINRAALADHLRHQWTRPAETYFEAIARVPSGHALTVRGGAFTTRRYWDPLFPGREPEWIDRAELGRFDELLDESVSRLVAMGRPAIYLSGGLDSVSIGALAADRARLAGSPLPYALSLAFPDPFSEEAIQAAVARQLGLSQLIVRLEDALGEGGLVRAATRISGTLSAPMQNPWLPAYQSLVAEARAQGCETILTGSGGDEWLTVTPVYAADLLRELRLVELSRLARTYCSSTTVSPLHLARNIVWRFGARPLLARQREQAMRRFAPGRFDARAMRIRHRSLEERPWLAPDPALRQELRERDEESARADWSGDELLPVDGPEEYFRECREALEHPLVSLEAEEVFEYSRTAGVRILHPYWDTQLVEFLHAVPPRLLNSGGRSKGLIRAMLARRFPELGFDRQRKTITPSLFASFVTTEAPAVYSDFGGAQALADAGVVDPALSAALYEPARAPTGDRPPIFDYSRTDPMWEILVLESWLRAHV